MYIHGRRVRIKRVTQKFSKNLACKKCERNIGKTVEQEEKLCDEV